jgi:formate dehydrogenase subunit gamma
MSRVSVLGRGTIVALFALLFAWTVPALAQTSTADQATKDLAQEQAKRGVNQPGNNAPVWREVRSGENSNYASIPGREVNVLVQTAGQEWRAKRNGFWSVISGWALVGLIVLLALAYWFIGTSRLHAPETGRKIQRFTNWERWVHWSAAISFSVLAITGLIMLFGKNLLLPIIGYTLFSWLAIIGKNLHNLLGPLFLVSVCVLVVTFIRDNIPRSWDWNWMMRLGGLIGEGEPPSGKYNAGEKLWFWGGALILGLVVGLSGLVLDFPNFDQTRSTMQTANIVHLISVTLFMLGGLSHIYLGTLGVAGAYDGMRTGVVDEEWAKEHHLYWYNDVKSGKVNAEAGSARAATGQPASGPAD